MKACQEKTDPAIHSIWFELGKTIKQQVEDVLPCVIQRTQGLHMELNEKIDETQVDL
jgi:hypothetical protein